MSLGPLEMDFLSRLVAAHAGVALDPDGATIAEVRLGAVARKEGLEGPSDVLRLLRGGSANGLARKTVEALLNGETFFFRDLSPFEALGAAILPAALRRAAAGEPVVVWSAACSGERQSKRLKNFASTHAKVCGDRLKRCFCGCCIQGIQLRDLGVVFRDYPHRLIIPFF